MKERRKRETSPRTKPTTLHPASALLAPQRVDQRDPIQSFHDAWCSDPGLTVGAWVAGRTVAVILLGRLMTRSGYGRFLEGCKVYQYPPSGKRPHSFNMGGMSHWRSPWKHQAASLWEQQHLMTPTSDWQSTNLSECERDLRVLWVFRLSRQTPKSWGQAS